KKSFYGCSNYPECTFTLAEHFRKKKLTKTNVKELLEGKETLVKGIKTKDRKSYNLSLRINIMQRENVQLFVSKVLT
ncbi:topoisomerase DNA-binding C4 zinc finger domain-containing protein, partial [Enterococcus faecium]